MDGHIVLRDSEQNIHADSVLSSVIAGLDPAIHAKAKVDRTFGSLVASRESPWTTGSSPVVTKDHRAVASSRLSARFWLAI
ncbi:MAG: hypothetical protein WBE48_25270, partial [Xanthobacteraceae bacterium]